MSSINNRDFFQPKIVLETPYYAYNIPSRKFFLVVEKQFESLRAYMKIQSERETFKVPLPLVLPQGMKRALLQSSANICEIFSHYSPQFQGGKCHLTVPLLGGGNKPLTKAKAAYKEAKDQEDNKFFIQAIKAYELAVTDIKNAIKAGYKGQDLIDLNTRLRDSHHSLGVMKEAINDFEGALTSYKEAYLYGKEQAAEKVCTMHIKLAEQLDDISLQKFHLKQAEESIDLDTTSLALLDSYKNRCTKEIIRLHLKLAEESKYKIDQTFHLLKAQKLGSKKATKALKELEEEIEVKEKDDFNELDQSKWKEVTTRTLWKPGFQTGKGITKKGVLTSLVVQASPCRKQVSTSHTQHFEYLISQEKDIKKLTHVPMGLSINQNIWHLKIIANYIKSLKLEKNCIHCLVGTAYVSPTQEVFINGKLEDSALRYLQREGLQSFMKIYGTHFIGGCLHGAVFLGCITLIAKSPEEAIGLRLDLEGTLGGFLKGQVLTGSMSKEDIQKRLKKGYIKIIGAKESFDLVFKNFKKLETSYKTFLNSIKDPRNLTPVEACCEPWYSLDSIRKCLVRPAEAAMGLQEFLSLKKERILHNSFLQSSNLLFTPLNSVTDINKIKTKGVDLNSQFEIFLKSNKKVFVLLGKAGSGKSFYLRHCEMKLWEKFDEKKNSLIPILIELGKLTNPVTNAVNEHLVRQGYTQKHIQELKNSNKVILFFDGYDEGRYQDKPINQNLFVTNNLHEWNGKVVISGRINASKALNPSDPDHLNQFAPIEGDRIQKKLVEEHFICPFSPRQVCEYLDKYLKHAVQEIKTSNPALSEEMKKAANELQSRYSNSGQMSEIISLAQNFLNEDIKENEEKTISLAQKFFKENKNMLENKNILALSNKMGINLDQFNLPNELSQENVQPEDFGQEKAPKIDESFKLPTSNLLLTEKSGKNLYDRYFKKIPGLAILAETPFILHAIVQGLPKIMEDILPKVINADNPLGLSIYKRDIYRYFTEACFEREEAKKLKMKESRPKVLQHVSLNETATEFCAKIAEVMDKEKCFSVTFIEEDNEIVNKWRAFLGTNDLEKFLRDICSDILLKNIVYERGKFRDQYQFVHEEIKNYFLYDTKYSRFQSFF